MDFFLLNQRGAGALIRTREKLCLGVWRAPSWDHRPDLLNNREHQHDYRGGQQPWPAREVARVCTYSGVALPATSLVQTQGLASTPPSNKPLLFIDKLSMTFSIKSKEHQQWIAGCLMDLSKATDGVWQPARGGSYKYAARYHLLNEDSTGAQSPWTKNFVLFQAQPRNGQGGYLRMEWNPARFSAVQRDRLFKMLDDYFDLPPPRVDEAKVTRVDIAVDLPGVRIGDYAFERAKSPIRTNVLRLDNLETTYLGKKFNGQFCVYDKSAQLGDTSAEITRVETHICPNKIASGLHTMSNPFKSVRVTDLAKLDLGVGEPHMRTLRRAIRAEGMAGPLSDFPAIAAAKHKVAILAAGAKFWQPVELWKSWPAAIAAAFPAFGQPDFYGPVDGATSSMQSIAQSEAIL